MVALSFNAQQVAPNAALEPLPSGTYDVMITASSEKPTKAGNGQTFIELEMTVQNDAKYGGRKVYDRLNIRNNNAQAVEIAYGTLSAICHVTNRHQIQDTGQLHGVPFKAVVSKVARDDKPGEYSNEVKGYKDIHGNDPGQAGAGPAPGTQPQGGGAPQAYGQGQGQPQAYGGPPQGQHQWAQPQSQQPAPQAGASNWAGGQPQQPQPGGPAPHQGPGGQQYPDPAHQPHQNPAAYQAQPGQGQQPAPQGGPPAWAAPQGGPPAWAAPQGGQPVQQQQPAPQANGGQPQGQEQQPPAGFNPGAAPPWDQPGVNGQPTA